MPNCIVSVKDPVNIVLINLSASFYMTCDGYNKTYDRYSCLLSILSFHSKFACLAPLKANDACVLCAGGLVRVVAFFRMSIKVSFVFPLAPQLSVSSIFLRFSFVFNLST